MWNVFTAEARNTLENQGVSGNYGINLHRYDVWREKQPSL